ncbi:MAG: hypothetical protein IT186_24945 [Acidobacteria bacterium]|nr:hypothetical protein [Acidobacteriota bacterium]
MDLAVRVIALVVLVGSGPRTANKLALPLFGLAAAATAGGLGQDGGSALTLALELLFLSAVSWGFLKPHWSPIALEALVSTLVFSIGPTLYFLFRLQGIPWPERSATLGSLILGLFLFGIHASWAASEEGWRRVTGWMLAVASPPSVAAAAVTALDLPSTRALIVTAVAVSLALLAWAPLFYLETRRLQRELTEEARLGLLPEEDIRILASPLRRSREKMYGRPDERREFVRSALMLAVARQQQRRRQGEKARLRQLEILTFRTRIRRVLEARQARLSGLGDEGVE